MNKKISRGRELSIIHALLLTLKIPEDSEYMENVICLLQAVGMQMFPDAKVKTDSSVRLTYS